MDEVTNRKLEALDEKQDIDRLVELYTEFQAYIEELARCLKSRSASPELAKRQEALRLHIDDNQGRFVEWHEGEQLLNAPVFSLVRELGRYAQQSEASGLCRKGERVLAGVARSHRPSKPDWPLHAEAVRRMLTVD